MSKFTCAVCGGIFETGWSDEEAKAELKENFGNISIEECDQVCDDCYKKIVPDKDYYSAIPTAANMLTGRFKENYKKFEHEFLYGTSKVKPVGLFVEQVPIDYESSKTIIYIAGKVTGDKHYRRKFKKAEKSLKKRGYNVINPAVLPRPEDGIDYEKLINICFTMIDQADAIYLLKDWQESAGAKREHFYAKNTNKTIMYESAF